MKVQHSVVEFLRGSRPFIEAVEIAEILTCLGDVAGIVVVFRNFMSSDNRSWLQTFKLVERSNPFKPALRARLGKIRVISPSTRGSKAENKCPLCANSGHRNADRAKPVARRVWREDAGTRRLLSSQISLADLVW